MTALTDAQKHLVEESFDLILGREEEIGLAFYDHLFEVAPGVKHLFKSDQKMQATKLIQMISVAVHHLDAPDVLVPGVQALARRHVGYGTQPEHYAVVGEALLWTLKDKLGEAFTPEVEAAWAATYTMLSQTMIAAAHPEAIE